MNFDPSAIFGSKAVATTSSAVKPTLIFLGIAVSAAFALVRFADRSILIVASILAVVIVLIPLILLAWQIYYFTRYDPDRLHNEHHLETKLAIKAGVYGSNVDQQVYMVGQSENRPGLSRDAE